MQNKINAFSAVFEKKLQDFLKYDKVKFNNHYKAMEYSLTVGGKRLRPFILSEFYKAAGGNDDNYLNFAAALEMIHTYSLVHDDLPCMDNDDFRRGKPSCHKAFGEATALLAGDGLLTYAFLTAAKTSGIESKKILKGIEILAELSGADGMIGGQVIDLECEKSSPDFTDIIDMYKKKTGALLAAAGKIGTVLAGGNAEMLAAAEDYGYFLGLAFQIKDDILDIKGDSALLGKPVGSDDKNNKFTYVSVCGIESSENEVLKYTAKAKEALSAFGDKAQVLSELADYLVNRKF